MKVKLFTTPKIAVTKTTKPTQYTKFADAGTFTNYEPIPAEQRVEKLLGEFDAEESGAWIIVHGKKDVSIEKDSLTATGGAMTDFRIEII